MTCVVRITATFEMSKQQNAMQTNAMQTAVSSVARVVWFSVLVLVKEVGPGTQRGS